MRGSDAIVMKKKNYHHIRTQLTQYVPNYHSVVGIQSLLLSYISTATFPFFFFFNDTPTTEIYTLSLHDALPIWPHRRDDDRPRVGGEPVRAFLARPDRKSTRLNSSHEWISYAVFCLKKKKI